MARDPRSGAPARGARTHEPTRDDGIPDLHALLATYLLTGGRFSEVRGLMVDDVSFDRRTITFRPHDHRRLKTTTSHRTVPLWPQLEEILRTYMFGGAVPRGSGLLFPSARSGADMIEDPRKAIDSIAVRAGWQAGEIRTRIFRHTYCAARLQTLDRGAPVSVFTVGRELGHGGDALVRRVYGHLGDVRHRSEVVQYRIEQHVARMESEIAAADADPRRRGSEAERLRMTLEGYRDRVNALRS